RHAGENRVAILGRQLALGDRPIEIAGDPRLAGLGPRGVGLIEHHLLADRRVDLADAVAHQPRAGDEDVLDGHRANGIAAAMRAPSPVDPADARGDTPRPPRRPPTRSGTWADSRC